MGKENLFNKVWKLHTVKELPDGRTQLFIGLHLIHEVTTPQAFSMLRERNLTVAYPERTFATVDHILPTHTLKRPFIDVEAEGMISALEHNLRGSGIRFFDPSSGKQGIVHVIGPELGLTQPGMTIACGDSHTSTHGAFGAIALGIGTSQVRDVLATQCIATDKPKVRKININGELSRGVYAKDVILKIIKELGVNGGIGFAYEYSGEVIQKMSIEERMTVCNMSIEGGAKCGYVNPDKKTFDYVKNRIFSPKERDFENAVGFWKSITSEPNAEYDDYFEINGSELAPMVTWGINPGQAISIEETIPKHSDIREDEIETYKLALGHMGFKEGDSINGRKIDVAFIGSCTNSRISDLREAAGIVEGKKASPHVKAFVVPGSQQVKKTAEAEGLDKIFNDAGFEWRNAGCSICLGMNEDRLAGDEICASSSNRNFIGRQGSPKGRTLLMSPAMVAVAAINGKVSDVRDYV